MTGASPPFRAPRSWLWTIAFVAAMAAMVLDARLGLLASPWHSLLKVLVLVLGIPLMVSVHRQSEEEGPVSPALTAYNLRMGAAFAACIMILSIAPGVAQRLPPGSAALWLLALAAAAPLCWGIWVTVRYLAQESDEYLRHLTVMSTLAGLAVVLVATTLWGFLDDLGMVPEAWAWWPLPVFAVGMTVARAWLKARSR
ncbi:MAG TPA: hypothetical protein VI168_08340 [Croceibacterium sp.]